MKYRATFSTVGSAVKIHADSCSQAVPRFGRASWKVDGRTVDEAVKNVDESEQLTERGWKIIVCKCARVARP